jgi:SAM-dependent methyltransferase
MVFDRNYFETQYASYELQNPPRKMAFYRHLAETAAAGCERPRVLDIGCAFGLFLACLDSRWERYGVDISEYAITRAGERVPGAMFEVTASSDLVFPGSFDVISAFDVLEHMHAPDEMLRRIAAALRPRGGFIFVVPVYDGLTGPAIRLLDRDPTHVHRRERDFWLEMAGSHFRIVDWWGIFRYLLPGGFYCHLVTRYFRRHTPAIACLARLR